MSFTSAMPANMAKLCGAVAGYVFVSSSDEISAVDWSTGIESQIPVIDIHSFHDDSVMLLAISLTSIDRAVAIDSIVGSLRCSLLRAPAECTPENFDKLLMEGRLDEYRELEKKCYVPSDHVNSLIDCFEYIADLLENLVKQVEC